MDVILATTWYPRGEFPRLVRFLPILKEHYTRLVVCFIPSDDRMIQDEFTQGQFASDPQIVFILNDQRRNGRYMALKAALGGPGDFIHYVDLDRLLHWVETRPGEWLRMLDKLQQGDFTIFGRSEAATDTHPQALITSELLSNRVV